MKKLLLGVTALLALSGAPALAADMPVKARPAPIPVAIYDWTGFYIGINGGGGWSRKCWDLTEDRGLGVVVPARPEGCHDANGGTVGGQIGYRWQASSWVFGVEAQGNWADFKGSNTSLVFLNSRNETRVEAFGLFTGQVGYAWNNVLLYVKGGAAVTSDKYRTFDILPANLLLDTASETRWGGVVGAGVEFGFAPNWSVAFEYDHLFMGDRDLRFTSVGNRLPAGIFVASDRIRQDVDLATVRVNYRFGGPIVARY